MLWDHMQLVAQIPIRDGTNSTALYIACLLAFSLQQ